jgi:glucose/arabinose dehydrogenase
MWPRGVAQLAVAAVVVGVAVAPAASRQARADIAFSPVPLKVPAGDGAAPFDVQRSVGVPSGWSAAVWARVPLARFALWTPQKTLLVSSQTGQVVELTPGSNPAAAPRETVLLSGLTLPQGMAFDTIGGTRVLYVAESNEIDRYVWKSNGTIGARTVVVRGLPNTSSTGDDVHRSKGIAIGPDHTIYVTVGSSNNASPERAGSPPRATIVAYRSNGTHMRVFARGVRNGEGLAFAPDGSLWTAVNGRDQIPYPFHRAYGGTPDAFGQVITGYVNEHPPDELARLSAGRNLGWPFCNPDPDTTPGSSSTTLHFANLRFDDDAQTNPSGTVLDCAKLAPLERGLPAHSAPLGLTFLEGSAVPAPWSRGAIVAVHGSWDRTPPRAPALLWLPWNAAKRTLGTPVTLVGGFQDASGARWGRPTDAVAGPDGDLYVVDDTAGAVYRIGPS